MPGGELGASETPPKTRFPKTERWLRRPERRCAPPRLSAEVPPSRGQVVSTRRDLGGAPGPRELYSKEKRRLTRFRPGQAIPVRRLFGQRRAVWSSSHGDVILQKIEVCSEPARGFLEIKGKLPRLIGAEADVACSSGLLGPRCTLRSSHRVCARLGGEAGNDAASFLSELPVTGPPGVRRGQAGGARLAAQSLRSPVAFPRGGHPGAAVGPARCPVKPHTRGPQGTGRTPSPWRSGFRAQDRSRAPGSLPRSGPRVFPGPARGPGDGSGGHRPGAGSGNLAEPGVEPPSAERP